MSITKTVKLNSILHEELKSIADNEGLVLQDLIEEKLTEILEEKGVFNFNPTDIVFSPKSQHFTLTLSPEHYQSLVILFKRLCLNEKISNLTQMNSLLETIKKLETVYQKYEKEIGKDPVNDFFNIGQQTIANLISEFKSEVDNNDIWKPKNVQTKEEPTSAFEAFAKSYCFPNVDNEIKDIPAESAELLKMFEQKSKYYEQLGNNFKKGIILSEFKDKLFKVKINYNDIEILRLRDKIIGLPDMSKITNNLYYLYTKDDSYHFAGDPYELINELKIDLDISKIEKGFSMGNDMMFYKDNIK